MTTKFSQFVSGGITRTSDITVGLRGGVNYQFSNLGVGDSAGNYIVQYSMLGSGVGVNFVNITNAATGNAPTIAAAGTDASGNLTLAGYGTTGYVLFSGTNQIGVPVGTTGQRPSNVAGGFRFNSSTGYLEFNNGTTWTSISNGSGGIVTINGTANQIDASTVAGVTTLSLDSALILPGTLTTSHTVTLSGLTASTILALDASKNIISSSVYPGSAGASGTILRSNGTAWVASTATFADTYAASTILYASGANAVSGLATTNSASLSTNASGVPTWLALTDGQIVIGSSIGAPLAATLTAGSGITITNAHNSITIAAGSGVATTFAGDAGTATPAAGVITISGGSTGLTTTASGSTVSLTGTLGAVNGGTAQSTYATGDMLYASAANTLSKLAGNTTAAIQYLSQTGTGVASQAPVWATISGGDITGAALTKVDDTNVTLTLGGTPATALLRAASITAGWTGQLSLTRGGTNASLTASNGGIVYSTATAFAILSGTATANQVLLSGSSAAPAWSTATYPATTTINQLLYSSANNVIAGLTTANNGVVTTGTSGTPAVTALASDGQLIIGSGAGAPAAATITAGSGISVTNAHNSITIAATGAVSLNLNVLNGYRLTLTSGTPVTTGAVTLATTLYLTPYSGYDISLYTGSAWQNFQPGELSITNAGLSASTMYDVFVQYNSGTPQLSLTAWTNTTTRATALAYQNGVLVLSGTATSRYVGTVYTDGATKFNDSSAGRNVWNYYNRVSRSLLKVIGTSSWTYATNTWRQANADTANQLNFVVGVVEDLVICRELISCSNDSNAVFGVGIGFNSTTNPTGGLFPLMQPDYASLGTGKLQITADGMEYPIAGLNYAAALEIVTTSAGTVTFYGNAVGDGGLAGTLRG